MIGKPWMLPIFCLLLLAITSLALATTQEEEHLGHLLYFDQYLSLNHNQSCASCHHPHAAFADPLNADFPADYVVSLGSDVTLNGGRNAPTSAYAAFIPIFHSDGDNYVGGQFWDGRADTLKDQAKGPFVNGVEMGLADAAAVMAAIADPRNPRSKFYQELFLSLYDIDLSTLDLSDSVQVANAYDKTAEAIARFEQTWRFTKFTSKYDYYLAGAAELTPQELAGLEIFNGKGNCTACHPSAPEIKPDGCLVPPLFSNYSYENLGLPKSENPMIASFPIDYGLGGRLGDAAENGKFRVQTLRNIASTPPYGHNGYFATLEDMVLFLNTAGDGSWPPPEVDADNVNREELGSLGLTPQEQTDLVAFLNTLDDCYAETTPKNFVLPPLTPLD